MKKTKRIALIIAVLMLMAVCFAFGVSAETCGDYEYTVLEDGTVEISRYIGNDSEVIIPEEINGKAVTVIGEDSFIRCKTLESVTFSEKLETIESRAFMECGNIKSVIIPDNVKYVGERAFYRCTLLEYADVGDGLEELNNDMFSKCWSLKTVKIGKNVSKIDPESFWVCTNLTEIIVDEENLYFYNDENGAVYDKINSVLVKYPEANPATSYEVAEGTLEIGRWAFGNNLYLSEIKLPSSLRVIGAAAFACSSGLKEITIPESVELIDDQAFFYAFGVEKIYFEGDSVEINEPSYLTALDFELFDMTYIELAELFRQVAIVEDKGESSDEIYDIIYQHFLPAEEMYKAVFCIHDDGKAYTAEDYATENSMPTERCHFYAKEWTYDYDNMVRYRECTFSECTARIEEPLESTEDGEVDIIAPSNPDTDFEVEEVQGDNFLVVEETVKNGIEGDFEVLKAFDINLKNGDGVHVQPDGTVKVKLPNDWSKNGTYKVYRVNDDGTLTDMNAYRQGSHLVFDTDHFSIYVIVVEGVTEEEPETPDTPAEPETPDCDCFCHAEGILNRILVFVYKLIVRILGTSPLCECGVAHY